MAKLWTFSGINGYAPQTGKIEDYVWAKLPRPMQRPKRRYVSRLGTTEFYVGDADVGKLASERILDAEATAFVSGKIPGGPAAIRKGSLRNKQVRCLLLAPKTTTRPPQGAGLLVEIYASPMDNVPNQSIFRPDSKNRWKKFVRGGGHYYLVRNSRGRRVAKGHEFSGFMVQAPAIMKRKYVSRGKRKKGGKPYQWEDTGKSAPWVYTTIWNWLRDPDIDYVFVAHSQGTNIAMHVLRRGFA